MKVLLSHFTFFMYPMYAIHCGILYGLWPSFKTLQAKDSVFKGPRSQKDQNSSQETIAEEKKQYPIHKMYF